MLIQLKILKFGKYPRVSRGEMIALAIVATAGGLTAWPYALSLRTPGR